MQLLRGIGVVLLLFFTTYLGAIFMQGPFVWLIFVSPSLFHKWIDFTMTLWMTFTGTMMRWVGGINVREFGEAIRPGERALLILNHRTRLDYLYLWSSLARFRTCSQEKIVLKSGLDKIPGAGWAMQFAGFIFLRRRWELDRPVLTNFITYFYKMGHKMQLLLFPEGTNLSRSGRLRSNEYAEKHNLPLYNYVLHPRTTGFQHIVRMMEDEGGLDAIYDITVAYPGTFPLSERELALGHLPPEVHFNFKRYTMEEIPHKTDEELRSWLTKLWVSKEQRLASYYTNEKMFEKEIQAKLAPAIEYSVTVFWAIFMIVSMYYIYSSWFIFLYFMAANIAGFYFSFVNHNFHEYYMRPVLGDMATAKKE